MKNRSSNLWSISYASPCTILHILLYLILTTSMQGIYFQPYFYRQAECERLSNSSEVKQPLSSRLEAHTQVQPSPQPFAITWYTPSLCNVQLYSQLPLHHREGPLIPHIAHIKYICVLRVCVCAHAQSCLTLGHPMDCYPPGSSLHGILQARILE